VKVPLVFLVGLLCAVGLHAQEIDLPPIVVTGTFELRRGPSPADSFARFLEKEIEAKRAVQESAARAPFFNARFWNYIPLRLESCSSDSSQFFTPNYLTSDYRNAARVLEESRKHSLFDSR
jgi:hypothetical protein